jgi:hypothetical protein
MIPLHEPQAETAPEAVSTLLARKINGEVFYSVPFFLVQPVSPRGTVVFSMGTI